MIYTESIPTTTIPFSLFYPSSKIKKVSFFFLEGAGPFLPISLYKSVGTKMSAKLCETIMGRTGEEHKSVLGFAWRSLTVVRDREGGVMFDIIFPLQRRFIRFRPPLLYPCMRCDGRASIEESLLLVAYSETQEEEEDHKQKEEEEEAGRRRSRLSGSDDPQSWRKAIQLYRYKSSKALGILCRRIIRETKRDDITNNQQQPPTPPTPSA